MTTQQNSVLGFQCMEGLGATAELGFKCPGKPQVVVVELWMDDGNLDPALCGPQLESVVCASVIGLLVGLIFV